MFICRGYSLVQSPVLAAATMILSFSFIFPVAHVAALQAQTGFGFVQLPLPLPNQQSQRVVISIISYCAFKLAITSAYLITCAILSQICSAVLIHINNIGYQKILHYEPPAYKPNRPTGSFKRSTTILLYH